MSSIDIVIPNFNYGHYLQACVESVTSQGVDNLRILIIDNASTDNSVDIAQALSRADPRITVVVHPENLGANASFNEGVDWAEADYFLILCCDDLLAPGALKKAMSVLDEQPNVTLTNGRSLYWHTGSKPRSITPTSGQWTVECGQAFIERVSAFGGNPVSGPTAIVRTSAQKCAGHYNPALPHTDDLEMWLKLAALGDVATTDRVQAVARVHGESRSASVASMYEWSVEFDAAYTSFFLSEGRHLKHARTNLRKARRALSDRCYSSALLAGLHGDRQAFRLLAQAIRLRPGAVLPPVSYLLRKQLVRNATTTLSIIGGVFPQL